MNLLKYILIAMTFLGSSLSFGETPVETNFKQFFGTYKIVACKDGAGNDAPGSSWCRGYDIAEISFPDPFWRENVYIVKYPERNSGSTGWDMLATNECTLDIGSAECDKTAGRSSPEHDSIHIEKISENSIRLKVKMTSYRWDLFTKIPTGYSYEIILEKQTSR
jgi:hypothetical protein